MNVITLCPSCLIELPDDYPFDHVEIDRAVAGDRRVFADMNREQRTDVVVTGLARGKSLNQLAVQFGWSFDRIQELLPDEHLQSAEKSRSELQIRIRELYDQDLTDGDIALRLGRPLGTVSKMRSRMKLPSKFGPGGRRKRVTS